MYYTHLYGEIRKSTILLYRVFDVTTKSDINLDSITKEGWLAFVYQWRI